MSDNTTETWKSITLPKWLCEAIESYLDTDWKDGRDPSGFGAMNAVWYIGERIAAVYASCRRVEEVTR